MMKSGKYTTLYKEMDVDGFISSNGGNIYLFTKKESRRSVMNLCNSLPLHCDIRGKYILICVNITTHCTNDVDIYLFL